MRAKLTIHKERMSASAVRHIALDSELEAKYQHAMRDTGLKSPAIQRNENRKLSQIRPCLGHISVVDVLNPL